MKILVLVDELHRAGGLERSLMHKVAAWVSAGEEVEVLTLQDVAPDFHVLPDEIIRTNLDISYLRDQGLLTPANIKRAALHFVRLFKYLRKARPQVVLHCGYGFDFYFLPLVAPHGSQLVKENHSSRLYAHGKKGVFAIVKGWIRRLFESRYHSVVYLSDEEAATSGLNNACVIPNPVSPIPADWCPPRKLENVIAAGRICRVKGFDRLVEVWALLADKLPDWQLHIYGDGERQDVESLQALIAARRLQHCVHVHPATTAIHERIAESRIYAMTSRSECFPMVLLEAMQLGVPVVAYDCPTGPRNILRPGVTGILVEDGNAAMFAQSLLSLALDPQAQQSMGRAARDEARRYELEQVMPLWANVFGAARD